ncbi:hypothetical protein AVEN_105212-1 [Araneus ventricosus]|uniref:Uncharacterized protein n=1 Tax=Araneus ventricosus TaxID=182803 RepID=A0A4Y2PYW5_ARAVE|nr:hypothetical protein AVEN_105212-1 [Araneus ventricosus]
MQPLVFDPKVLASDCGNPVVALLAGGKRTIRVSRCEAVRNVAHGCSTRLAADLMMGTPHLLIPPENTLRFLRRNALIHPQIKSGFPASRDCR